MKSLFSKSLLVAGLVGMLSVSAQAATLKIATLSPDGSGWMTKMRAGAAEVKKRTEGRVDFKFYTGGTMGNDRAVLNKIRIGQLHGGAVTGGSLVDFSKDLNAYSMPLKFKTFAEVDYVRNRMDAGLSKSLEDAGMVNFGFAEGGFAYAMSKNAPISSVAALRKGKVWIPDGDPLSEETLKSFGVSPVPLSLADVLPSLQTGIIDTVASSPIGTLALQWHTQVKFLTDVPMSYFVGTLAIDKKAFNKIAPADQAILREVMNRVFKDIDKQNRKDNVSAFNALVKQGIKVVKPTATELVEWQAQADKASDRIEATGIINRRTVDAMDAHLNAFRASQK